MSARPANNQPTLADLLAQLGEAYELAGKAGNLEAMIEASWRQAQLLGYVVERSEVRYIIETPPGMDQEGARALIGLPN